MSIPIPIFRRLANTALCIIAALLCAGCASLTTYHNKDRIPGGRAQAIAVDAKQRFVLSAPHGNGKDRILRFCAEPPPDVFTAISSSFGLKAALGTEKARQDISADIQQALSENAATIGKTQTVNILREMMYRNCERYLSGAITEDEFIVQAARDQRAIVHVLAIEQLTGAARTQAIALTTAASATSSGGGEQAMKILQSANDERTALAASAADARKAANTQAPTGACQSGKDAYADASSDDKAKIPDKQKLCEAADAADAKAKQAADHYAEQKKLADRTGTQNSQASGSARELHVEAGKAAAELAQAVKSIVIANNDFNEIGMTCVVLFRNFHTQQQKIQQLEMLAKENKLESTSQIANAGEFATKCLAYLDALIAREKAQQQRMTAEDELRTVEYEMARKRLIRDARPAAKVVWDLVQKSGRADAAALQSLDKRAAIKLLPSEMKKLIAATDFDAFETAFARLRKNVQAALRNAAEAGDTGAQ